ncbi:hypothetical protein FRC08_005570 [Ceratobasidium sp. 394]|nr:hypothetical protein FRC08_005570 [Ceratobasidium sp. 394]
MPFMRRASSGTFSSDGEASVSGTPTRRGAVGGTRGGLGGPGTPKLPQDQLHLYGTARASPILSKGKRTNVPLPAFQPPAVVELDPTMTLGRLEREYTTVQQIGKGTFGQVLKVEKDGRLFAVKRSKPFEGVRHWRRMLEEVDILQHLATGGGHSNVLKFVDATCPPPSLRPCPSSSKLTRIA